MTYMQFHFLWTLPLLAVVLFLNRKSQWLLSTRSLMGTGLLCFLALVYTTPWDSYLIQQGIWTYKTENIIGTLYWIPYEEYFFFFIQTIIGCIWTGWLLSRFTPNQQYILKVTKLPFIFIALVWTLMAWISFYLQWSPQWNYLILIVLWAFPILFMQWSLGVSVLTKEWKTWLTATASLTLYFWVADSFAILQDIWSFPAQTISGLQLFNILPIEEALFFLVTNLMVVQGYILFSRANLPWKRTQSLSGTDR